MPSQPSYAVFYNEVAAPETLAIISETFGPDFELWALSAEDEAQALSGFQWADLVLAGWRPVPAHLIAAGSQVRLIHKLGAGVEKIDLTAARQCAIPVTASSGSNAHQVAEHSILLMLALYRRLLEADRSTRAGRWEKNAFRPRLRSLYGKTIGIIGLGNIGRAVAQKLGGFGCHLLYYDLYRTSPEIEQRYSVEYRPLEALLPEVDILTLHVPLTPQTRGLIGTRELALLRSEALLINTARGAVVDQQALQEALCDGRLAGAGLDVFQSEPPQPGDSLFTLDTVVLTPHIAGSSRENIAALAIEARDNFLAVLQGREPQQRVA